MYFELTAPNQVAYARATWEAEMLGLDPEAAGSLTFNIILYAQFFNLFKCNYINIITRITTKDYNILLMCPKLKL